MSCFFVLALAANACAASAQDSATVIVTASRGPQPLIDAVAHATVITREAIDRSQALDLATLLARESGVEFASNGGRGTATSLFVRGAPARQVLVLVDGVPLARQDATGQVGIEHLMLDQVERVEIVRGNLSALYGAGAIGGVIQVFTRSGSGPGARAHVTAQAGSLGLAQVSVQGSQAFGDTTLSAGISRLRSRGASAIDTADQPAANPDRDRYDNTSASLALDHALSAHTRLGLGLNHTDASLDYDSVFATPVDTQRSRTRVTMARAHVEHRVHPDWGLRVVLSEQRERAAYVETGAFGFDARYATTVRSLSWTNALTVSPGLTATAGLDLQRQRIDADDGFGGAFDRSRSLAALYGAIEARLGEHQLQLQLRRDHVGGGTGGATSARVGWAWSLAPSWRLLASAANAFSAPPLGYLHAPFFGNPDLKPERARSIEAGVQWTAGAHLLRATAFASRVRDELDYDLVNNRFDNLARTRNRGAELSYSGRIGATDLRASLTSQDPQDASTGQRRLRRAATLASATLSHELGGGWRAGVAWRHAGQRSDAGGVSLPAYDVADLTAQWDIDKAWQLFARIENLGDVRYQTAFGYTQPARSAYLGLRWRGGH